MIEINIITTEDSYYELERNLRNRILLRPIGLPDHAWEMNDHKSWHFVAIDNTQLIGCVVLFPNPTKNKSAQLMQMAVESEYQGKGIGRQLVVELLNFAREQGLEEVTCHSRQIVNHFYKKKNLKKSASHTTI